MLFQIILLCLITLIPALELRASIPYGILGSESWGITPGLMHWSAIALVCILCNIILGLLLFHLMPFFFFIMDKIPPFRKYVEPFINRARDKLSPYVEKYGTIGVALFIGIPLPGSGVYTGSLGAFVIGVNKRSFMLSCLLGVLIAGFLVTLLTLLVQQGMQLPFWADWIVKGH